MVVVAVLPTVGRRFAATGRAEGADTALARAEADPTAGFLAAAVPVVADDGRAEGSGALVVVCN